MRRRTIAVRKAKDSDTGPWAWQERAFGNPQHNACAWRVVLFTPFSVLL